MPSRAPWPSTSRTRRLSAWTFCGWPLAIVAATLAPLPAAAQAPGAADKGDAFYKGKQISLIVGAGAGGAYDLVSRTLAQHWGRHIPGNPSFIVSNMHIASGLAMTNYLSTSAPKDGTAMGMGNANIALEPGLKMLSRDGGNVQFDALKLNWIGSPMQLPQVIWVYHTAPAKTFADLKTEKTVLGSMGVGGDNYVVPWLANQLLGTKMEMVTGYKSQAEIFTAAERGEVHGNTAVLPNLTSAKAEWWRDKKVRVLMQASEKRIALLPDVPTAVELAGDNAEAREVMRFWSLKYAMSYPLFLPPAVPPERVKLIRDSFDAMMKDPQFLAEAKRLAFEIDPLSGEAMTKLVAGIVAAPKSLTDRVGYLMLPLSQRK